MSGHDVVVVGGANTDYLVKGEHLPRPGETLQGEVFQEAAGGKGANQAVAVARLGCRAGLIARVGDDERGARILAQLAAESVDRISAERAARVLLGRGVQAVVVQAGHGGDLLVTADEARFLPRLQVESVDATGAGDAFAAALAVGLAEERPLAEAAALGSAAAALATTRLGAQAGLPRREEVLELYRTSHRRR